RDPAGRPNLRVVAGRQWSPPALTDARHAASATLTINCLFHPISQARLSSPHESQCSQFASATPTTSPGILGGSSMRNSPCFSSKLVAPHNGHFFAVIDVFPSLQTMIQWSGWAEIRSRVSPGSPRSHNTHLQIKQAAFQAWFHFERCLTDVLTATDHFLNT